MKLEHDPGNRRRTAIDIAYIIAPSSPHIQRIILYGSVARGNHRDSADIDLCVTDDSDSPNGPGSVGLFELVKDAVENLSNQKVGKDREQVDIEFIGDQPLASNCNPFARKVNKEGVTLIDNRRR